MTEPLHKIEVDPTRLDLPETGYYVRAEYEGKVGNHDIATLTRASLNVWLRSRGGANEIAEAVVCRLLGHGPEPQEIPK
jgi:hypothetical protein